MEKLIKDEHFVHWKSMLDVNVPAELPGTEQLQLEAHSFTFYTSVSVMSSSKIEGEELGIDSFVKHKILNVAYLPELTEKPNDLYKAYLFAKENRLSLSNFLDAHKLISAHLLPALQQGVVRKTEMLVMEHKTGRIQYEAAPSAIVHKLHSRLWNEIDELLQQQLNVEQVFYYASFIHLAFVNIHPFTDGNGRIARLLEKWFLAEKLGEQALYIKSEKYYYHNVNYYYNNLARVGLFYEELDYKKSIPFLLMLPQSLVFEK